MTFGGPKVSPDQPSPDSQKIAESLVLLEFVTDLYPNSTLLPKDPVLRAKARFFIDAVSTKFLPAYIAVILRGEPIDELLQAIEALQDLLPTENKGRLAIGDDFTIADASVAPFLAPMEVALKNDYGAYAQGEGTKAYQLLQSDPKYARFRKYFSDLKARDSLKSTLDEVCCDEIPVSRALILMVKCSKASWIGIRKECPLFVLRSKMLE